MGYGSYSHEAHRALTSKRSKMPREAVFVQRDCHPLMNPNGLKLRESRDSAEHPNSLGVVFALDVTGSMGHIPEQLARTSLPTFMKTLLNCGVEDAQVLFMAAGDATSDRAPLQVGQFESEAALMDQWLTWSYLEGGGGGSGEESYELAMYTAARHTAMDCWEKRAKRGYYFMTGDERPYPRVSKSQVKSLIGDDLGSDVTIKRVIAELEKTYHPFFLIPDKQRAKRCERRWRDLMGDHCIVLESAEDTCLVAAAIVGLSEGRLTDLDVAAKRLSEGGADRTTIGRVVRALQPWAASLDLDVDPGPRTTKAKPGRTRASGHRRV